MTFKYFKHKQFNEISSDVKRNGEKLFSDYALSAKDEST